MGIRQVEERPKLKPRGIIRLGYKEEGEKGRMHNTEHFILTDAPDVAAVYGENPQEIDIIFPSNIIDQVAPSAFEYWKSVKNKSGDREGILVCRGDGPSADGTPGQALWLDREVLPPREEWIGERDPATGNIARMCYGDGARGACKPCSNFRDQRGNPLCKPTMRMYVVLPRVSMYEFYLLTTHSWHTITDVLGVLHTLQKMRVPITSRVFTLYKESKGARPWSETQQRQYQTIVQVVRIRENKDFMALHGDTVKENIKAIVDGGLMSFLPTLDPTASLPPPPAFEDGVISMDAPPPAKDAAAQLLEDPEVARAFAHLETLKGVKYSEHSKIIAIRKKEHLQNPKEAVLNELNKQIQDEMSKNIVVEQEASVPPPPEVVEEQPPTLDDSPDVEKPPVSTEA